jgi:hypothetical protein
MRWKMMKMYEWMSLEVNSKWYEDLGKSLGKVQGFPNELSDLQIVKYLPETQEKPSI